MAGGAGGCPVVKVGADVEEVVVGTRSADDVHEAARRPTASTSTGPNELAGRRRFILSTLRPRCPMLRNEIPIHDLQGNAGSTVGQLSRPPPPLRSPFG